MLITISWWIKFIYVVKSICIYCGKCKDFCFPQDILVMTVLFHCQRVKDKQKQLATIWTFQVGEISQSPFLLRNIRVTSLAIHNTKRELMWRSGFSEFITFYWVNLIWINVSVQKWLYLHMVRFVKKLYTRWPIYRLLCKINTTTTTQYITVRQHDTHIV